MSDQRTTASGHRAFGTGFTMITGVGGAPVDRSTADRMCRGLDGNDHGAQPPVGAQVARGQG